MNDLISVIIPVYNTQKYLRQCLDSIINQTYKNLEIVCVNDGSSDNSLAILKEYQAKDKRIKVIDKENGGVSCARNVGLDECSGDYVMFVDSDDYIANNMCELMLGAVKENDVCVCMCCYTRAFKEHNLVSELFDCDRLFVNEGYENEFFAKLAGLKNEDLSHPESSDSLVSPCMQLFKRESIGNIRFEDLKDIGTSEDWLFQLEVYAKQNAVMYINKPLYYYRKTNEGSITSKYKEKLYIQWQNLYNKVTSFLQRENLYEKYKTEINNKIAVTMLFLGLNEIKSKEGIWAQAKRLKQILETDKYAEAYKNLSLKFFPIHWGLFFFLCKYKITLPMVLMLHAIEYLRTHKKS